MAQIRKRGQSQYQARVRLKGYPEQTKTFDPKQHALAWAAERERLVLQGFFSALREADKLPLRQALERYGREVTPSKKGQQQELSRLRCRQQNPLTDQSISHIRGVLLTVYGNDRFGLTLLLTADKFYLSLKICVSCHQAHFGKMHVTFDSRSIEQLS